jgi:hypothetical protein
VALLIAEARPGLDADAMAHVVLAPLSAELLHGLGQDHLPRHRAAVSALVCSFSN